MQKQPLVINNQAGVCLLRKKSYEPDPQRTSNQFVFKAISSQVGIIICTMVCTIEIH